MNPLPLAVLFLALYPQTASPSPQDIVRRAEAAASALESFQTEFEQTFFSSSVEIPHREKGRLSYQKPGRMRWEYTGPKEERKIFVYKDGRLLSYYPADNQLIHQTIPEDEPGTEIFGLLSGRGRPADRFTVEMSPFPSEGGPAHRLRLTPREEGETAYILLEIEAKTFFIRKVVIFDWAGNKNELFFSRLKTNPRLAPDVFEIQVPADCEIIDDAPARKR